MANNFVNKVVSVPVEQIVQVKNRYYYIVRYDGMSIRVPLLEGQNSNHIPAKLTCKIQSITEFGYPNLVQLEDAISTKEKEQVKVNTDENKVNSRSRSFLDRFPFFGKKQTSVSIDKNQGNDQEDVTQTAITVQESSISDYIYKGQDSFESWLKETGGIKRRLEILLSLAYKIEEYHRKDKVYKELSPSTTIVKVMNDGHAIVQLIETDNSNMGLANIVAENGYSAPELVNKLFPNTPMSDCFTFAIFAHLLIDFCHPYYGDKVIAENLQKDADKGKFPWIDDPDDKLNRLTKRFYDRQFVNNDIHGLFMQTFKYGQHDPIVRPTIYSWIHYLEILYNDLVCCKKCKENYIYSVTECCPFCDVEHRFDLDISIRNIGKRLVKDDITQTYNFKENQFELYPDNVYSIHLNMGAETMIKADKVNFKASGEDYIKLKLSDVQGANTYLRIEPFGVLQLYRLSDKLAIIDKFSGKKSILINDSDSVIISLDEPIQEQRVIVIHKNK